MSLIGFDCNGKPLYAGDRCVVINSKMAPEFVGKTTTALSAHPNHDERVLIDLDPGPNYLGMGIAAKNLRKLPKDQHRSVDRSFEDMMRGLKTLMPESNHP